MTTTKIKPNDFLNEVYEKLDYVNGIGYLRILDLKHPKELSQTSWFDLAKHINAEAIFFVNDFPTVLFFKCDYDIHADTLKIERYIHQLFLKVWNTSSIPLFFVALPGEIRVYSAYQKPLREKEWCEQDRFLKRVKTITRISDLLEFSKDEVESGNLFKKRQSDFDRYNRVDYCLLNNLRLLRKELEGGNKNKREFAHALIGRSIFIKYLEDRKILSKDYFIKKDISIENEYKCYTDVLISKKSTYNLFKKLNEDFNGDLFPLKDDEEIVFNNEDFRILREFLLGKSLGNQLDLFFWAYEFDIIPIELISNIYEEFYHEHTNGEYKGTHYTPTTLVDFILTDSLTIERLNKYPKVLDPACGSGIFLVETFKRMVYHECKKLNIKRLPREKLIKILIEQIKGIDINRSAIQVAAFSLYLAYLDFLEPSDILKNKQLPKLVYNPKQIDCGHTLYATNAFFFTLEEKEEIENSLEIIVDSILPLDEFKFDLIIGNPPWGSIKPNDDQKPIEWCNLFKYPVGDKEFSQCFLWRVRRLIKKDGEICLLISSGILFKHQAKSINFRKRLLKENFIRAIYNFDHIRHVFFSKQRKEAISPFIAIFFKPTTNNENEKILQNKISYISIKQCSFIENLQAVIINKTDFRKAKQGDFLAKDWLWKTLCWGSHNDEELIEELKNCYPSLSKFSYSHGRGYQDGVGKKNRYTDELGIKLELKTNKFDNYMNSQNVLEPIIKRKIHSIGQPSIYIGPRLLIKRGVSRSGEKNGEIKVILVKNPFAFKNSIIGIRLDNLNPSERKILLGILLSSLAKYYHFLTCSTWGRWHDDIHVEEHLKLPINFPKDEKIKNRIISMVDKIIEHTNKDPLFFNTKGDQKYLKEQLDNAIFELYELSEAQQDLIRDLCSITLDFYYSGTNSKVTQPPNITVLEEYCSAFLELWKKRLEKKGKELETRIFFPKNSLLCGISFELMDLGTSEYIMPITDNSEWKTQFEVLSRNLPLQYSKGIYIDRIVKEIIMSRLFLLLD